MKLIFYILRSFPFDWKTPFGYTVAWISETVAISAAGAIVLSVMFLILGSSWLFLTVADHDLTKELAAFNIDVKTSAEKDHEELMQRFCNIMQVFSDVKE